MSDEALLKNHCLLENHPTTLRRSHEADEKKTVITNEEHEVWVIRRADPTPEAKDQTPDIVDSAKESLVASDRPDPDKSPTQPERANDDNQRMLSSVNS